MNRNEVPVIFGFSIVYMITSSNLKYGDLVKVNKKGDRIRKISKSTDSPIGTVYLSGNGKSKYKRGESVPIWINGCV